MSDPAELKVWTFDSTTLAWEAVPVRVEGQFLIYEVNHFSMFTMGLSVSPAPSTDTTSTDTTSTGGGGGCFIGTAAAAAMTISTGESGNDEGGPGHDRLYGKRWWDKIEQDTGDGLLGLLGLFQDFSAVFSIDDFFFVDPNADDPDPVDDQPMRVWIQEFLDKVGEDQTYYEDALSFSGPGAEF